jgi:hypothetical protein
LVAATVSQHSKKIGLHNCPFSLAWVAFWVVNISTKPGGRVTSFKHHLSQVAAAHPAAELRGIGMKIGLHKNLFSLAWVAF